MAMMCQVVGRHDLECENQRKPVTTLAARGRSRKDGFPTVGAVCDRPYFVNSRKNARSQTAPTIDTANSTGFCHGLLVVISRHGGFAASARKTVEDSLVDLPLGGAVLFHA